MFTIDGNSGEEVSTQLIKEKTHSIISLNKSKDNRLKLLAFPGAGDLRILGKAIRSDAIKSLLELSVDTIADFSQRLCRSKYGSKEQPALLYVF